ncbi:MAG: hypothetical protein GXZ14_06390 [Ruminococcaceae bacterium]|nr:hypothetical protein [Oscillospiraceae bacterium]
MLLLPCFYSFIYTHKCAFYVDADDALLEILSAFTQSSARTVPMTLTASSSCVMSMA